jgi:hypothetical protein
MEGLAQPRPVSSTGSSGSDTVDKLERRAAARESREHSEVGVKQHIGTSVKSLYRLARVAGIDREEFERVVRMELECLSLMDEDEALSTEPCESEDLNEHCEIAYWAGVWSGICIAGVEFMPPITVSQVPNMISI